MNFWHQIVWQQGRTSPTQKQTFLPSAICMPEIALLIFLLKFALETHYPVVIQQDSKCSLMCLCSTTAPNVTILVVSVIISVLFMVLYGRSLELSGF